MDSRVEQFGSGLSAGVQSRTGKAGIAGWRANLIAGSVGRHQAAAALESSGLALLSIGSCASRQAAVPPATATAFS
jgi:hypothetical protein